MLKIELEILGLTHSQTQSGAYVLVLAEKNGERRFPIVIGATEAQAIAIQLENLIPIRPLTHDLLVTILSGFAIYAVEIIITKLSDGVFFSDIICEQGGKKVKFDARTSDAVAIALRFKCPIYAYETVLEESGIIFNPDRTKNKSEDITTMSIESLNKLLAKAVENEEYEKASIIRDEIKRRQKKD